MKKYLSMILALVFALSLCACSGNQSGDAGQSDAPKEGTTDNQGQTNTGEVFKLGAYFPLSGSTAAYGNEAKNSVELAVEIMNENGGFNGVPVELIVYDTNSSTEEALKCAKKLVEQDQVDACIMSVMSSEVMASAGVLNDAGILAMVCGGSSSIIDPENWSTVYRAQINASYTVRVTLGMMEQLNYNSVAVFRGPDESAFNTGGEFIDAAKEAGYTVTADETYDIGDTDYSAQMINIAATNPDCVYISLNGEDCGPAVKQLRQHGYSGIILDKESFMISQMEIAGVENSNYIAFSNLYLTYDTPNQAEYETLRLFLERYEAKYGQCPDTDSSYRAYDNAMAVWEASKIAGSNERSALVKAMDSVKFDALGGVCDFTSGKHEGFETFGSFILIDGVNTSFENWYANGGYTAYLEATGRDR